MNVESPEQLASGENLNVSEDAIRQQMQSILGSSEFKRSPALQEFLRFIVEKTLAGQAQQIKGYTVATQVFRRKENFDGLKDPIVRIQAGRLRSALERFYMVQDGQFRVRIEIPKGTYIPVFHSRSNTNGGEEMCQAKWADPTLSMPAGPPVAVMPLVNLTGDPAQDYFSDGLTEELTAELARYQDFRVISVRSAMRQKGRKIGSVEVNQELGVRFFLEGSVRKNAETIKINVQLIDTATQVQIWGEQYHRDFRVDSIIALQEEIACAVVAKIGGLSGVISQKLSKESRRKPPEALETYEAFLRVYQYHLTLNKDNFARALDAIRYAVARDPECGLAWSMLANLYADNYTLGFSQAETTLEQAMAIARKGASLEPQNQYARSNLAYMHFLLNEREMFFREAEQALALNPNAPTLVGFIGWEMVLYGERERGVALMEKGMKLNPYYPGWFHLVPYLNFYQQGRYEEAYQHALKFQAPHIFWDPLLRAAALGQLGREREARAAVDELLTLKPDFHTSGPSLMQIHVKTRSQVGGLLEGLQQAGLGMSSPT